MTYELMQGASSGGGGSGSSLNIDFSGVATSESYLPWIMPIPGAKVLNVNSYHHLNPYTVFGDEAAGLSFNVHGSMFTATTGSTLNYIKRNATTGSPQSAWTLSLQTLFGSLFTSTGTQYIEDIRYTEFDGVQYMLLIIDNRRRSGGVDCNIVGIDVSDGSVAFVYDIFGLPGMTEYTGTSSNIQVWAMDFVNPDEPHKVIIRYNHHNISGATAIRFDLRDGTFVSDNRYSLSILTFSTVYSYKVPIPLDEDFDIYGHDYNTDFNLPYRKFGWRWNTTDLSTVHCNLSYVHDFKMRLASTNTAYGLNPGDAANDWCRISPEYIYFRENQTTVSPNNQFRLNPTNHRFYSVRELAAFGKASITLSGMTAN